jgi:hypothetical protein
MRLCAVFLAIFLPAALVAAGCFFFTPAAAVDFEDDAAAAEVFATAASPLVPCAKAAGAGSSLGFTWMILRVLVGGGGRINWSFGGAAALLRDLTASLACTGKACIANMAGDVPVDGEPVLALVLLLADAMAGGGSSKDICSDAIFEPSWLWRSVEDAGVGGNVPLGILGIR